MNGNDAATVSRWVWRHELCLAGGQGLPAALLAVSRELFAQAGKKKRQTDVVPAILLPCALLATKHKHALTAPGWEATCTQKESSAVFVLGKQSQVSKHHRSPDFFLIIERKEENWNRFFPKDKNKPYFSQRKAVLAEQFQDVWKKNAFSYPPISLFQHFLCFPHSFWVVFCTLMFSTVFLLHPQCRAPSSPEDSLFFFPLLNCLPHVFAYFPPLQQKRVQAKIKTKWEATTFLWCSTVRSMEACHLCSGVPTGITAIPVLSDKDVMLLRQPLLIVFWDAEQTRCFFLREGHPIAVTLNTGQSYSKWGTGKPGEAALCAVTPQSHNTQPILQPQPYKLICTMQLP